MNIIVLAAGQGTRLAPLTNERPKGMVEVAGKSILKHQLDLFKKFEFSNKVIVTGYKQDKIQYEGIKKVFNADFETTNMVHSFFCAEEFFNEDIIISYGDIVYSEDVLKKIYESDADMSVVIDKDWEKLWSLRMEDPLADAETLKIEDGKIAEIGKKPKSLDEIQGQYIGLIKIKAGFMAEISEMYKNLDKNAIYDGKTYPNMFMTSLVQLIIDKMNNVSPVYINGQWIEIDSVEDLETYERADYLRKENII
jgi:choline kinase